MKNMVDGSMFQEGVLEQTTSAEMTKTNVVEESNCLTTKMVEEFTSLVATTQEQEPTEVVVEASSRPEKTTTNAETAPPKKVEVVQRLRMLKDVLKEPGMEVAPTKRRRIKAKRKTTQLGNILDFFPKILAPKEWKPTVDGKEIGRKVEVEKRKAMELLEDDELQTTNTKFRRKMVEEAPKTGSRTTLNENFGAQSFSGRDLTDRRKWEAMIWVDNENEGSGQLPGDLDSRTK